jgi:hypothetical protein
MGKTSSDRIGILFLVQLVVQIHRTRTFPAYDVHQARHCYGIQYRLPICCPVDLSRPFKWELVAFESPFSHMKVKTIMKLGRSNGWCAHGLGTGTINSQSNASHGCESIDYE